MCPELPKILLERMGVAIGFKSVAIGGTAFWSSVSSPADIYNDGEVFYVVLDDSARMELVRRTNKELFSITAAIALAKGYRVIVNGLMYTVHVSGLTYRLGTDPIDPADVTPDGQLIESSSVVAGRPAPLMFFVSQGASPGFTYRFGAGDPSSASPGPLTAMGGAGPLIIGGLKYGNGNLYKPGTAAGPGSGDPGATFVPNLIQRNNQTYIDFANRGPSVGKTVIAHCAAQKKVMILGNRDAAPTGITLDDLRDKLFGVGVENAVFLDGSDSVLYLVNGMFLAHPGKNKNRTIPAGLGFRP